MLQPDTARGGGRPHAGDDFRPGRRNADAQEPHSATTRTVLQPDGVCGLRGWTAQTAATGAAGDRVSFRRLPASVTG